MTIVEYSEQVKKWLLEKKMTDKIANALSQIILDASESELTDEVEVIETAIFGNRVECPKCGSMTLPSFSCWGCDEWVAPMSRPDEREERR